MRIRGLGRMKRIARRASANFRSQAIILLYHRVVDTHFDPQALCVSPENFDQHLKVLKKSYTTLSVQALVDALKIGELPKHSVVISFDDGYVDNLKYAKPLLEKNNLPATVFVSTGNIDTKAGFWWDDLAKILLGSGDLPKKIRLEINGKKHEWDLSESTTYSQEQHQDNALWNVAVADAPTPRHALYRELCGLLRPLRAKQRNQVIENFLLEIGRDRPTDDADRTMSSEEICQLTDSGLINVGAHTVTHSMLSALEREEQKNELFESKAKLEEISGKPVKSFSYPFGGKEHYNAQTIELAREVGFSSACSNFPDLIGKRANLYELPRFLVRNWGADEFENNLKRWFRG